MRKFTYLAIAIAVALSLSQALAAPSQLIGLAGHWRVTLDAKCLNAPANVTLCQYVLGSFPAIGKRGTVLSQHVTDVLTVSAYGQYNDTFSSTLTETARSAKTHRCPPAAKLSTTFFSGSCKFSWTGHGHVVRSSHAALLVFHIDTYAFSFNGSAPVRLKGSTSDTGLPEPARVGLYSAAWVAQQAGVKRVPAGFSSKLEVTHEP